MHDFLVYLIVFLAAALALFSGFGLGTILTPVFILFFDIKIAIFFVAIVHLLNNLLKLILFRQHIDLTILKRFGFAAVVGSFLGALGQVYMINAVLQYIVGFVLIILGLQEWVPAKFQFRIPKSIDPIGGFLSGLLGGLVGNQGAIRSAFLLNYEISKEAFIATGVVLACIIDLIRIPIYWFSYAHAQITNWSALLPLIAFTFLGTLAGKPLLKYFSVSQFRKLVAALVILIGVYFIF